MTSRENFKAFHKINELECQRLEKIVDEYSDQVQTLKAQLEKEVVREEYSSGGQIIHRGYYCPSPVNDILIKGANRGRLLKRMTVDSKPTYRYGINRDNKLIVAYKMTEVGVRTEIIIRKKAQEIGFQLYNYDIETISECTYYDDGKLASYVYGTNRFSQNRNWVTFHYKELYTYSDDRFLQTADLFVCNSHQRFHFEHDEEGYLTSYTVTVHDADGNQIPSEWFDGRVYEMKIRRKA